MRKSIVLLLMVLFLMPFSGELYAFGKKKNKKKEITGTAAAPKKQESKYDKLLKKPGMKTVAGQFITLHQLGNKVYFEFPLKYMGRELLIASTLSETSNSQFCTIGHKENTPMHVQFKLVDSTIFMCGVNAMTEYNNDEPNLEEAVRKNFMDPCMKKYTLEAYNKDSSAVVFDVSPLFAGNEESLAPIRNQSMGMISIAAAPKPDLFYLGKIKAFDDNVSIETNMTHSLTVSMFIFRMNLGDISNKVTRTVLLLPEDRMKPRVSDSRIGIFLTPKQYISTEEDGIKQYTYANRWRLEPKDMNAWSRGELVEPVKPIVFYVDNTFPADWVASVHEGVLRWNKAFEKIGFKNAVQTRSFPNDDPNFDPDNLKYSCIRYIPSRTMNAMGPSWVDPSTGEIINASVSIYNDIIKLINYWRFTQTSQVDPSVRDKKMPASIVNESVAYVVAHEVGHTLGLMHNMAGSSAFPVDSLRSASFTQKYGTTPSIMDYARFNYVAQPGDKGVKLTPPDLGCYDEYAIKWLYSPFAGNLSVREESEQLEKWVDEKAGDPLYRYGRQQVYSRYDPSAIEEDLGNDPMKASEYGIKNLKYILKNMNEWIGDDESTAHRQGLHKSLAEQYYRYIMNVLYNVGGIYQTEVKDGTSGIRYASVSAEKQKASLKWAVKQLRDCGWIDDQNVMEKFRLGLNMSPLLMDKLSVALFDGSGRVAAASHVAGSKYTQGHYFDDLYATVFEETIAGRKLTNGDKMLQRMVCERIGTSIAGKAAMRGITDGNVLLKGGVYTPSVEELCAYSLDESGFVALFADQLKAAEAMYGRGVVAANLQQNQFGDTYGYGWQREVDVLALDETKTYFVAMVDKITRLLQSKMASAHKDDQAHYQALLMGLQALKK